MTEEEKKLKRLIDTGDIGNIRQAIELGEALGVDRKFFQKALAVFVVDYFDNRKFRNTGGLSEVEEVLSWVKKYRITTDLSIIEGSDIWNGVGRELFTPSLDINAYLKRYIKSVGVPSGGILKKLPTNISYYLSSSSYGEVISHIEHFIDGEIAYHRVTKWFEKRL